MRAVVIQEVECLIFCIFWCQLPKILKARQKRNASDEKKVTAQIQNLFASVEGRKTVQDFELGGLESIAWKEVLLAEQAGRRRETGGRAAARRSWVTSIGPASSGRSNPRLQSAPAFTPFAPIR